MQKYSRKINEYSSSGGGLMPRLMALGFALGDKLNN
jgi:hypothetical protein